MSSGSRHEHFRRRAWRRICSGSSVALEVNIPVSLNAASVAATEAKLALLTRNRSVKIDVDSSWHRQDRRLH